MAAVSARALKKIWAQVPTDYYFQTNVLQNLWHRRKWQVFQELFTEFRLKPRTILEVGCASGHLTTLLADFFPDSRVTGIDAYKEAIVAARRRYPHISFQVVDAHKLPFKTGSFDLVVCSETIEHVVEPAKMLREIGRVVTPNGWVLVEMDSGSLLFRGAWFIWTNFGKGKVWRGAHLHPFRQQELTQLIVRNGFNIAKKRLSHLGMAVSFLVTKK